jgi:CRISPR-associated protein Cas2
MVVLILERVTPGLRGELTRWLLEPKTGVFAGHVSAIVRDKLWEKVCQSLRGRSAATLIHTADNEQGFAIRQVGETTRHVHDFEGLLLVTVP